MPCRIDIEVIEFFLDLSCSLLDFRDSVNLISEKFDSDDVVEVTGDDIYCISFYSKTSGHKLCVVSLEEDFNELFHQFPA